MKKVVYSVVIGDYDKISNFTKLKGYKYFLFSDIYYNTASKSTITNCKNKIRIPLLCGLVQRFCSTF